MMAVLYGVGGEESLHALYHDLKASVDRLTLAQLVVDEIGGEDVLELLGSVLEEIRGCQRGVLDELGRHADTASKSAYLGAGVYERVHEHVRNVELDNDADVDQKCFNDRFRVQAFVCDAVDRALRADADPKAALAGYWKLRNEAHGSKPKETAEAFVERLSGDGNKKGSAAGESERSLGGGFVRRKSTRTRTLKQG